MECRSLLIRPAARLLSNTSTRATSYIPSRGHKTTARTKRSLKKPAHESFLPDRSLSFPAADSIIYNPPASEASPLHTPFKFLPASDPRRAALDRLRQNPGLATSTGIDAAAPKDEGELPPVMRYLKRSPNYNLKAEDIQEMKRLRNEDPIKWSANALAEKFSCSNVFVRMAAPAPPEHLKALKAKMERREARWGPIRRAAREDRKRRTEMLYRGEL